MTGVERGKKKGALHSNKVRGGGGMNSVDISASTTPQSGPKTRRGGGGQKKTDSLIKL